MHHRLSGILLILSTILGALAPVARGGEDYLQPSLDLRIRQERLVEVFQFDPELSDRDWLRIRTRAGLSLGREGSRFELRLCNEFRRFMTPDTDLELDELIVDRLLWSWRSEETPVFFSVGRQDIIWPGGFIMLEGHPLDGSRSMYQNAMRAGYEAEGSLLELTGIFNPKRDPMVLAGDQNRPLADADESALALRWLRGENLQLAFIWKQETDPDRLRADLEAWTLDFRFEDPTPNIDASWELALQRQRDLGWALAAQARFGGMVVPGRMSLHGGGFFHSGETENLRAFRSPWGRWPKWSELYLYSLVPEGGPANWANVAGSTIESWLELGERSRMRLAATALYAPAPDWESRGVLLKAELRFHLMPELSGHLLWEGLETGPFHAEPGGASFHHFLRWQVNLELK
jgi:hypothetical protein